MFIQRRPRARVRLSGRLHDGFAGGAAYSLAALRAAGNEGRGRALIVPWVSPVAANADCWRLVPLDDHELQGHLAPMAHRSIILFLREYRDQNMEWIGAIPILDQRDAAWRHSDPIFPLPSCSVKPPRKWEVWEALLSTWIKPTSTSRAFGEVMPPALH